MIDTYAGRTQGMLRRSATVLALTVVAACSRETLLEVETPDQISPADAANPAGAQALRAAAIGNFHNFYSGTINVGANLYGGLISDELINARPGGDHIDQRAFNENTFPNLAWNNFGQAIRNSFERAGRWLSTRPQAQRGLPRLASCTRCPVSR
jgi:hypothetical protein